MSSHTLTRIVNVSKFPLKFALALQVRTTSCGWGTGPSASGEQCLPVDFVQRQSPGGRPTGEHLKGEAVPAKGI